MPGSSQSQKKAGVGETPAIFHQLPSTFTGVNLAQGPT